VTTTIAPLRIRLASHISPFGQDGAVKRLLLAALLALWLVPAASAGPLLDTAVTALQSDPVYVDPQAERAISAADADRLRAEIESNGGGPIYVAVLSDATLAEAGGDAGGVLQRLQQLLGRGGAYAVVAGNHFRAGSTDLATGEAGRLATQALDAKRSDGVAAVLLDWVDRVGAARRGGTGGGGSGGSGSNYGWLGIAVVAVLGFLGLRAFRRRRVEQEDVASVREAARDDLVALADDVQGLELRVEDDPAAKRDYDAALEEYARASSAFDRARTPEQLAPVAEALEEGRYRMASAEARLEGRPVPQRRPACFFDPRHGPSVRDVEWAPPGGQPRAVPACAACALRVEEGEEPESRQVFVGGSTLPYWAAGPAYGGYFGGFFPGLLLGELLGGFGGFGWGGPIVYGDQGGGPDVGDFGGGFGDFGGGDFGGDGGGGGDF
jgi:hypothetical protein